MISWAWVAAAMAAVGCSGDGCTQPIPGGFPPAEREVNAGQIRVTQTGLAALTDDPAAVVGALLPGGLAIDVPASCGGTPAICCPGGTAQSPCGPVMIDLAEQPGDEARLELTPVAGQSRLELVIRARVQTAMDIPLSALGASCGVAIDTAPGADPDLLIRTSITFVQDPEAGTTRLDIADVQIEQLTEDDIELTGGGLCGLLGGLVDIALDFVVDLFADQIQGAIEDQVCKACPGGTVDECGAFADACEDEVCMNDGECVQELGLTGRLAGLLAGLSPGTTGAIDLYEVAGGYATTETGGIALGLLGGMEPGGVARDRCGPSAPPPPDVSIPVSAYFQGNTRPDTNAPYGIGIGLHETQLDQLAWAAYQGGALCITVDTDTVDLLSSDTIGILVPSLLDLTREAVPVALGLRPQAPPTIDLGPNTFTMDGDEVVLDQPLLDVRFTGLELDFFAMLEDQAVRLFTLVADVHLPVGLQAGPDGLTPVLGDLDAAFTNLSVKNSEAVTEDPEAIAALFPSILELALPSLAGGLDAIELPALGGLQIAVTDVTAVDDGKFLAIYGDLTPATMAAAPPAQTTATVLGWSVPDDATLADPRAWADAAPPAVQLALGGDAAALEFSVRTDGGLWSAWSPARTRSISSRTLWLPGKHRLEVRARRAGEPTSADPTPEVIVLPVGPTGGARTLAAGFHGEAGEAGCGGCASSSNDAAAGGLLLFVAVAFALRRRRRPGRGVAALILVGGGLTGGACDCSGNPCGDVECLPGEVEAGATAQYVGVARSSERAVVVAYDEELGDVVLHDVGDDGQIERRTVVDGVPAETPVHDPSTYRGGILGEGPDVGRWATVALAGDLARLAYVDHDTGDLRVAIEVPGRYEKYVVDGSDAPSAIVGVHAAIGLDGAGQPVVAYLATGLPGDGGTRESELRLARADRAVPTQPSQWTVSVLATGADTCARGCDSGECVAAVEEGGPDSCQVESNDCASACGGEELCVAGACRAIVPELSVRTLPRGPGLFANVVTLDDGRLVIVAYDRPRTALVAYLESAAGSSSFAETILDGADGADRGLWASAVAAGSTVHVAYQDALGDQLFYATWDGGPPVIEVVDDGTRDGDRPHPVGASAALWLDGTTPRVAYQDGLTADVVLATRGGSGWERANLTTDNELDGFYVGAAGGILAWDQLSHSRYPAGALIVRPAP